MGRNICQIVFRSMTANVGQLRIPANCVHHGAFVLLIAIMHFFVTHMWNILYGEIFNKLGEITPYISHGYIQRLL